MLKSLKAGSVGDINKVIPTNNEIRQWLLSVLKHSLLVEYYLQELNYGEHDLERPHDIVGPGNKYEWEVIKCLALQYRVPRVEFEKYILPGIELHRQQYHHRMWNKPNSEASDADLKVGAVDAICSLLEERGYQGGRYALEDIYKILAGNPPHKKKWLMSVYQEMKKIRQPSLDNISTISKFPNLGVSQETYNSIKRATDLVIANLIRFHGFEI